MQLLPVFAFILLLILLTFRNGSGKDPMNNKSVKSGLNWTTVNIVVLVKKILSVHNSATDTITDLFKYDHITLTLNKFHWVPVDKLIIFKLLVIAFICQNDLAPVCL